MKDKSFTKFDLNQIQSFRLTFSLTQHSNNSFNYPIILADFWKDDAEYRIPLPKVLTRCFSKKHGCQCFCSESLDSYRFFGGIFRFLYKKKKKETYKQNEKSCNTQDPSFSILLIKKSWDFPHNFVLYFGNNVQNMVSLFIIILKPLIFDQMK